jgi:hypothetical protein
VHGGLCWRVWSVVCWIWSTRFIGTKPDSGERSVCVPFQILMQWSQGGSLRLMGGGSVYTVLISTMPNTMERGVLLSVVPKWSKREYGRPELHFLENPVWENATVAESTEVRQKQSTWVFCSLSLRPGPCLCHGWFGWANKFPLPLLFLCFGWARSGVVLSLVLNRGQSNFQLFWGV